MSYQAGDVIDQRYKLVKLIGSGGQGHVFHAEDLDLGAPVAIKCLLPDIMSDAVFTTRIAREARAMGALSGTSATQILAFNRSNTGILYIVMELLEGRNLDEYLTNLERKGQRVSVERMLDIMGPIVDTLVTAHARGIVHRDVKPANIFVLKSKARGRIRLLDFGLAKESGAPTVTQEGSITGTPLYMAPEGWAGKPKELDLRLDVYAFGAVVFRILGNQPPFPAKRLVDLVRMVAFDPRPSLRALRPDLPATIDTWVTRILARSPADRPASIGAAWTELHGALQRPLPTEDDF